MWLQVMWKLSLKIFDLKPLHARWVVEMYDYLKQQKVLSLNGFDKASIKEVVNSANEVIKRTENPFTENQPL